jgi:hypothetical protein
MIKNTLQMFLMDKLIMTVRKSTNLWIGPKVETWRNTAKKMFEIFVRWIGQSMDIIWLIITILHSQQGSHLFGKELRFETPFINQTWEGEYYHWHVR